MYIQWKKIIITTLDLVLAFYLIMAVTSWNNPDENSQLCTKVDINISDANNAGFLTAGDTRSTRRWKVSILAALKRHLKSDRL